MKILTESRKEYKIVKELMKENDLNAIVKAPEDSVASVCWSIEDIRNYFPKETSDETLLKALTRLKKGLEEQMTATGWEIICDLKCTMLGVLDEQ